VLVGRTFTVARLLLRALLDRLRALLELLFDVQREEVGLSGNRTPDAKRVVIGGEHDRIGRFSERVGIGKCAKAVGGD
jgi:hypothetical protein